MYKLLHTSSARAHTHAQQARAPVRQRQRRNIACVNCSKHKFRLRLAAPSIQYSSNSHVHQNMYSQVAICMRAAHIKMKQHFNNKGSCPAQCSSRNLMGLPILSFTHFFPHPTPFLSLFLSLPPLSFNTDGYGRPLSSHQGR